MSEEVVKRFLSNEFRVNSKKAVQIVFEEHLANLFFRGDLSRVIYTSDDNAIRQRQVSKIENKNCEDLEANDLVPSLDLPFANYWASDGYFKLVDPNSSLHYWGMFIEGIGNIPAKKVEIAFSGTMYFDNENERDIAADIVNDVMDLVGKTLYSTEIIYRNSHVIQLPLSIALTDIVTAPDYTDRDWIKTHKVILMKFSFVIKTYLLDYPYQRDLEGNIIYPYNLGPKPYLQPGSITKEVLLKFAFDKYWVPTPSEGSLLDKDGNVKSCSITDQQTAEELENSLRERDDMLDISWITMESYFKDPFHNSFDLLRLEVVDVQCRQADVAFKVSEETLCNIISLQIVILGRDPIFLDQNQVRCFHASPITIEDLEENSDYLLTFIFRVSGKANNIFIFPLSLKTPLCAGSNLGSLGLLQGHRDNEVQ